MSALPWPPFGTAVIHEVTKMKSSIALVSLIFLSQFASAERLSTQELRKLCYSKAVLAVKDNFLPSLISNLPPDKNESFYMRFADKIPFVDVVQRYWFYFKKNESETDYMMELITRYNKLSDIDHKYFRIILSVFENDCQIIDINPIPNK